MTQSWSSFFPSPKVRQKRDQSVLRPSDSTCGFPSLLKPNFSFLATDASTRYTSNSKPSRFSKPTSLLSGISTESAVQCMFEARAPFGPVAAVLVKAFGRPSTHRFLDGQQCQWYRSQEAQNNLSGSSQFIPCGLFAILKTHVSPLDIGNKITLVRIACPVPFEISMSISSASLPIDGSAPLEVANAVKGELSAASVAFSQANTSIP
ncbi:hypothetical protein DFJ58DRAFT_847461 [Suillus subalutaceus]|uniref:uncharacterized protein n=1 Tax=Suillus subalutaceus TaxID=48586 RepID=UPI001B87F9F4|nr:uncharacterized protein DFJ58DRAFT_847461 [Suillus subalutaceus]KAG1835338.1 hypothetical protein DFJ58DRAFT_847461 [Suillus subalutaceus]